MHILASAYSYFNINYIISKILKFIDFQLEF